MTDFMPRRHERKHTLNLVEYILLGEGEIPLGRSMGRTRDVSEGGLLLETHRPLKVGQRLQLTLGMGDEMAQIKGQVIHVKGPDEDNRFSSGIVFTEVSNEDRKVLLPYIEALRS